MNILDTCQKKPSLSKSFIEFFHFPSFLGGSRFLGVKDTFLNSRRFKTTCFEGLDFDRLLFEGWILRGKRQAGEMR